MFHLFLFICVSFFHVVEIDFGGMAYMTFGTSSNWKLVFYFLFISFVSFFFFSSQVCLSLIHTQKCDHQSMWWWSSSFGRMLISIIINVPASVESPNKMCCLWQIKKKLVSHIVHPFHSASDRVREFVPSIPVLVMVPRCLDLALFIWLPSATDNDR